MSTRPTRAVVAVVLAAACHRSTAPETASIRFVLDAPFCGGTPYALDLIVDARVVGTETLRHGQTSGAYAVPAGRHALGGRLAGHAFAPDTTLTLRGGTTFTDTLSLYCS